MSIRFAVIGINHNHIYGQVECLLREALKARGVRLETPAPVKRGRPPKGE